MAGKFQVYKDAKGEHRFRLCASNGQTILSSEGYKKKDGCQNGIASVQKNSQDDARFEKKTSSSGKPYFVLKAGNNQVIGNSQMYDSERARDAGIDSVKRNGSTTKIEDPSA